jgi:hypothetical protein
MNWIEELRYDISKIRSSPKDLKKFGITLGVFLLFISSVAFWKHWWNIGILYFLGLSGVIFLIGGIFFSNTLKIIHYYWMSLALLIGSIISRVILFILFFIILTPIALFAKIFSKKFFFQYRDSTHSSYWIQRDKNKYINYERMS